MAYDREPAMSQAIHFVTEEEKLSIVLFIQLNSQVFIILETLIILVVDLILTDVVPII